MHLGALCLLLLAMSGLTPGAAPGVVEVLVAAGSDVILPCSLGNKEDLQSKLFDWKKDGREEVFMYDEGSHYNNGRDGQSGRFTGRVSYFQEELKHGNASIVIRGTKMADGGEYTCDFPRLYPKPQTFHIKLVVGAAPEPSISVVEVGDFGVKLKCDVRGAFPLPTLQWRDGDGNVLAADEPRVSARGDVSVKVTVTSTSRSTNVFICVATQDQIGHEVEANITLADKLFKNSYSKGDAAVLLLGGALLGAFLLLVVQAVLVALNLITISFKKASLQQGSDSNESIPKVPQKPPDYINIYMD